MKKCSYCGTENGEAAVACCGCGISESNRPSSAGAPAELATAQSDVAPVKLTFTTPTAREMEMDLVTLLRCRTLMDADLIVSHLDSAGIYAFIPDQFVIQYAALNPNAFGYVRIQVAPKDFESAKEFLSSPGQGAELAI